jgi:hypothetical protein
MVQYNTVQLYADDRAGLVAIYFISNKKGVLVKKRRNLQSVIYAKYPAMEEIKKSQNLQSKNYFTISSNSTSKISVEPGVIFGPAALSP